MLIVIPVCHKDVEICLQNLEWIAKIDPMPYPYTAAVSHDSGFDATKVIELAKQRFANVIECCYPPWRGQPQAWPGPQNWAWQETARWVEACPKENWLWWEQDAIPVRSGWLKDIVTEYRKANKPFMGHIVENFDGHMNGVGCYPYNLSKFNADAFLCRKIAFDIVLGPSIKSNVHKANHLFVHCAGSDPFTFDSYEDTKVVPKDCALFHRCKDGSLVSRMIDKKPRSNSLTKITSSASGKKSQSLLQCLMKWKYKSTATHAFVSYRHGRLLHCLERHRTTDEDSARRSMQAYDSWLPHYKSGQMVPVHHWYYQRSSKALGDIRDLPYFKDVLLGALNSGGKHDIVLWTNDDTIMLSEAPSVVVDAVMKYGAIASFRVNFDPGKIPPLHIPNHEAHRLAVYSKNKDSMDLGRDLFGFNKEWLRDNWNEIPDMLLGELEFDLLTSFLIRICNGVVTNKDNANQVIAGCELERGYILHERHPRLWTSKEFELNPAKLHNRRLANEFYKKHNMPDFVLGG